MQQRPRSHGGEGITGDEAEFSMDKLLPGCLVILQNECRMSPYIPTLYTPPHTIALFISLKALHTNLRSFIKVLPTVQLSDLAYHCFSSGI